LKGSFVRPLLADPVVKEKYDIAGQSFAAGHFVVAQTDAGTNVVVWRPTPAVRVTRFGYFCHGHSTLSHHLYGYSIPGTSLETVLREEWTRIGKKPMQGDIIVFRADDGSISHTCRVESATHAFGSSTATTLSTKNGTFDNLLTGQTIEQVQAAYPNDNWRLTGGCCFGCGTVKQYYRRNDRTIDAARSF
jgi:hypothetical protein